MRTLLFAGTALCALTASPALAAAQQAQPGESAVPTPVNPNRSETYDAAYFAQYAPRSALDIVRRIPGFSLDLGNTDLRGFSGAAGNVVIDGQRPSSKSESLEAVLERIPASRVTRVDVGSGSLYGAEYSGKAQVANIILGQASGLAGNVSVSGNRHWFGRIVPNASGSIELTRGPSTFSLSAGTQRDDVFEEGYDDVMDGATGERVEYRRKFNEILDRDPFVSGSWALEQGDNRSIHLNARFSPSRFTLNQRNHVTPVGEDERDDQLHQKIKTDIFEIGGDITRPLAGGGLKLVALANRRKRTSYDDYLFRGDGGSPLLGGYFQNTSSRLDETLGKLSWTRSNLGGFAFEAGFEVAVNKLDYALDLYELTAGGGEVPIDLPLENATVKETRGEAFVTLGREITKGLRADFGMRYEMSKLKVSGDASARRSLKFWKPSLTLDWQAPGGWKTQLILRRTVAQLDFYDFVSVAELGNGRISGGNANLVPQRTWEARLVAEHALLGTGKARIEIGHDRVSMLQDRVLVYDDLGNAFDSPGNLGTGKRYFANISIDAPLDLLWKGLRVSGNATFQRTRVKDPVTGETRNWSDYFPEWDWYVEARRDSGKWAYGTAVSDRDLFYLFRTDGIDGYGNGGPYARAFVEYRPNARSSLTLDVDNVIDTAGFIQRAFYDPNRSNPVPVIREKRVRDSHTRIGLTYKLSFGGKGPK